MLLPFKRTRQINQLYELMSGQKGAEIEPRSIAELLYELNYHEREARELFNQSGRTFTDEFIAEVMRLLKSPYGTKVIVINAKSSTKSNHKPSPEPIAQTDNLQPVNWHWLTGWFVRFTASLKATVSAESI